MVWPTVEPSDVAGLYRPLTPAEQLVAAARIKLVQAELNRELRLHGVTGTPSVGDPGYDTQAEVDEWGNLYVGVIAEVVAQSLKNPEGWLEESERIDDYERTRRRDRETSSGLAFLDASDVEKLLPPLRPKRTAFSIHLGQT